MPSIVATTLLRLSPLQSFAGRAQYVFGLPLLASPTRPRGTLVEDNTCFNNYVALPKRARIHTSTHGLPAELISGRFWRPNINILTNSSFHPGPFAGTDLTPFLIHQSTYIAMLIIFADRFCGRAGLTYASILFCAHVTFTAILPHMFHAVLLVLPPTV